MLHFKDGMSKDTSAKSNVHLAHVYLEERVVYDVIVAHNHILHNTHHFFMVFIVDV